MYVYQIWSGSVTVCRSYSRKVDFSDPQNDYEGRSINKLQNDVILLIFKMWKFWNISFVADLTVNTSCEFYYDNVTVTSFINIRYSSVPVQSIPRGTAFCYSFSVGKGLEQMPFSLKYVKYMVTSTLRDQQYIFGVNVCLWSRKCCWRRTTWSHVVSTTNATIAAVNSLMVWPACDGLNVLTLCLPCVALPWGQPAWQGLGFSGLVHEETHPCVSNF